MSDRLQLRIPAEYADQVREALTCQTCDNNGEITLDDDVTARVVDCPDCPPSFWWGMREVLVLDGRPLVELVTDCQEASGSIGHHVCNVCDGSRFVSLGVVTAGLLPIIRWENQNLIGNEPIIGPADATHAVHLRGANR